MSLPLRAYSILLAPPPVLAAGHPGGRGAEQAHRLRTELLQRLAYDATRSAVPPAQTGYVARVHAVQERRRHRGSFGFDELVVADGGLDLEHCHPMVTAGRDLVGFLAHDEERRVVVRLLHYRPHRKPWLGKPREPLRLQPLPMPRRVPAQIQLTAGGRLRCLVEPARPVEPWPLRCGQIDDPYLASRLRTSGQPVTTDSPPPGRRDALPAGLRVGTLKIWGYPERDLPVGFYVEPARPATSLAAVVLWHPETVGGDVVGGLRDSCTAHPVRWMTIPSPAGERWLVTARSGVQLRRRAALTQDGCLLGVLLDPWTGQSLALPFARTSRDWSLLFLPEDPNAPVVELLARVVERPAAGWVRLQLQVAAGAGGVGRGFLFTSGNGPDCPLGLFVGAVMGHADDLNLPQASGSVNRLLVKLPDLPIERPVVLLQPEMPR